MKQYRPRRAPARFLVGAPEYILDIFDQPKYGCRYTVLFGGSMLDEHLSAFRKVCCLFLNDRPGHPWFGISMWGEMHPSYKPNTRYRIAWLDLPESIRKHIVARVET